jgi:hypothetical protein
MARLCQNDLQVAYAVRRVDRMDSDPRLLLSIFWTVEKLNEEIAQGLFVAYGSPVLQV